MSHRYIGADIRLAGSHKCESCQELREPEKGKRHKQQRPPPECVDQIEGRQREHKVDNAEAHGVQQDTSVASGVGSFQNLVRIVYNHVDATMRCINKADWCINL